MSKPKIKVPEGMMDAALKAFKRMGSGAPEVVEAVCLWLIENPIVPTREEWVKFRAQWPIYEPDGVDVIRFFKYKQRCMLLAPEPEVPEKIKDLLWDEVPKASQYDDPVSIHNTLVLAAYLRGEQAKEGK